MDVSLLLSVGLICQSIEMFEMHGNDAASKEYLAHYRTLRFNLNHNRELSMSLLEGTVTPQKLLRMKGEEMARRDVQERNQAMRTYAMEAAKVREPQAREGMFQCSKCKSRKTTHYQLQTRYERAFSVLSA